MNKEAFISAKKMIESYDRIIIHRHMNPDGDAIGSQTGLKEIIKESYPDKEVYAVGDDAGRYSFMEGSIMDEIPLSYYENALSIVLDTSSPSLISDERWREGKETLRFDHHLFIEKFCTAEVIDSSFESTAGLITEFARVMDLKLNERGAKSLYTGMVTDSGRFLYDTVNARTHINASYLLSYPFDKDRIFRNLYSEDFSALKRKASFMERIKLTENNVAYVYSTNEDVRKMGIPAFSVSRGMVNTMANIKGVRVWVNFTEDGDKVLTELRSDGPDINKIAVKYGGGGHLRASGATLKGREEAMKMLEDLDALGKEEKYE